MHRVPEWVIVAIIGVTVGAAALVLAALFGAGG